MGSGHEAPAEKKKIINEEIATGEAIGKAAKAHLEVDAAKAKIEKAKQEGKPTEKLQERSQRETGKSQGSRYQNVRG
jgi:flagellar biosynthesis chaperone FliJ